MIDIDYIPNGRYWTKNIAAVREWAIARLKVEPGNEEIADIEDWCRVWIEGDPFDNGGDASVRREMRWEWLSIWRDYRRLGGPG